MEIAVIALISPPPPSPRECFVNRIPIRGNEYASKKLVVDRARILCGGGSGARFVT